MSFISRSRCRLREFCGIGHSEICAELSPRQTLPGQNDVLLLQPEGGFLLKIVPTSDKKYDGEIRFKVQDPFEIRNQSRPEIVDWDYNQQKLQFNEVDERSEVLMKAVLPEKFRGEASACISAIDCTENITVGRLPMKSDPPVSNG